MNNQRIISLLIVFLVFSITPVSALEISMPNCQLNTSDNTSNCLVHPSFSDQQNNSTVNITDSKAQGSTNAAEKTKKTSVSKNINSNQVKNTNGIFDHKLTIALKPVNTETGTPAINSQSGNDPQSGYNSQSGSNSEPGTNSHSNSQSGTNSQTGSNSQSNSQSGTNSQSGSNSQQGTSENTSQPNNSNTGENQNPPQTTQGSSQTTSPDSQSSSNTDDKSGNSDVDNSKTTTDGNSQTTNGSATNNTTSENETSGINERNFDKAQNIVDKLKKDYNIDAQVQIVTVDDLVAGRGDINQYDIVQLKLDGIVIYAIYLGYDKLLNRVYLNSYDCLKTDSMCLEDFLTIYTGIKLTFNHTLTSRDEILYCINQINAISPAAKKAIKVIDTIGTVFKVVGAGFGTLATAAFGAAMIFEGAAAFSGNPVTVVTLKICASVALVTAGVSLVGGAVCEAIGFGLDFLCDLIQD